AGVIQGGCCSRLTEESPPGFAFADQVRGRHLECHASLEQGVMRKPDGGVAPFPQLRADLIPTERATDHCSRPASASVGTAYHRESFTADASLAPGVGSDHTRLLLTYARAPP